MYFFFACFLYVIDLNIKLTLVCYHNTCCYEIFLYLFSSDTCIITNDV